MMNHFELSFLDASATLRDVRNDQTLRVGDATSFTYENAQAAAELAVGALQEHTGLATPKELATRIAEEKVGLTLRGHLREIRVAALHLKCRWGFPVTGLKLNEPTTLRGKIGLVSEPGSPDIYSTYRFDSDTRPLEVLGGLITKWHKLAMDGKSDAGETASRAERGVEGMREFVSWAPGRAPMQVVVTGVTGAGKSTFLNALLGRDLVAHSTSVCTSVVIRIVYCDSANKEGFTCTWKTRAHISALKSKYQSMIKEANSPKANLSRIWAVNVERSERGEMREEQAAEKEQLVRALEEKVRVMGIALKRARTPKSQGFHTLAELRAFTTATSHWAEALGQVNVRVHHPLLKHITLVDAPGLKDGDEERQKVAMSAFTSDAAWIYLVPASARSISAAEDWAWIKEHTGNTAGVVVLTKSETLEPDSGSTRSESIQGRIEDYRRMRWNGRAGWRGHIDWCAALTPSLVAQSQARSENNKWGNFGGEKALGCLENERTLRRALNNSIDDVVDDGDEVSRAVLADYILDASRVPACVRGVGDALVKNVIERRLVNSATLLGEEIRAAIATATTLQKRQKELLDVLEDIEGQREQERSLDAEWKDCEEESKHFDRRLRAAEEACAKERKERESAFKKKSEELAKDIDEKFEKDFDDKYKGQLTGRRTFSILEPFDGPFSSFLRDELSKQKAVLIEAHKALKEPTAGLAKSLGRVLSESSVQAYQGADEEIVTDKEKYFEWASTTKERMLKKGVRPRVAGARKRQKKAFLQALNNLESEARRWSESKKKNHIEHCQQLLEQKQELSEYIGANDPGVSRVAIEQKIERLAEHHARFEALLREVEEHDGLAVGKEARRGR